MLTCGHKTTFWLVVALEVCGIALLAVYFPKLPRGLMLYGKEREKKINFQVSKVVNDLRKSLAGLVWDLARTLHK